MHIFLPCGSVTVFDFFLTKWNYIQVIQLMVQKSGQPVDIVNKYPVIYRVLYIQNGGFWFLGFLNHQHVGIHCDCALGRYRPWTGPNLGTCSSPSSLKIWPLCPWGICGAGGAGGQVRVFTQKNPLRLLAVSKFPSFDRLTFHWSGATGINNYYESWTNFDLSIRIQVCPKKGISPAILWGWDWDHQSYSREGSGFLGYV